MQDHSEESKWIKIHRGCYAPLGWVEKEGYPPPTKRGGRYRQKGRMGGEERGKGKGIHRAYSSGMMNKVKDYGGIELTHPR